MVTSAQYDCVSYRANASSLMPQLLLSDTESEQGH